MRGGAYQDITEEHFAAKSHQLPHFHHLAMMGQPKFNECKLNVFPISLWGICKCGTPAVFYRQIQQIPRIKLKE